MSQTATETEIGTEAEVAAEIKKDLNNGRSKERVCQWPSMVHGR